MPLTLSGSESEREREKKDLARQKANEWRPKITRWKNPGFDQSAEGLHSVGGAIFR